MSNGSPSYTFPVFPIGLGFVAGFIDLFGFLQWHGLLTAHVTGNLVFFAYDLTLGDRQLVMKLAALPLFAVGVAGATLFIDWLNARGRVPFVPAMLVQAGALGTCMLAGLALPPPQGPDDIGCVIPGTIALFAMAMQNTMMRLMLHNLPPTTVMTGNVTQVVAEAVRQAAGYRTAGLSQQAKLIAITLVAFAAGAIVGGQAQRGIGYFGLLLPIAVLLALLRPGRRVAAPTAS